MFSVVCIEIAATAQEYGSHPTERRRYAQHALHVGRPRGAAGAAAREAVKAATNLVI